MKVILNENLNQLLAYLTTNSNLENRNVLELVYFAHHASTLKKQNYTESDYNKYYEEVQRMTDQELRSLLKPL